MTPPDELPPLPDIPAAQAAAADPVFPGAPTTDTIAVQTLSRRNWSRVIGGFAASLIVLTGVGFAVATINERVNQSPEAAALAEVQNAADAASATVAVTGGGVASAHWSVDEGMLVLVAQRLPAIGGEEVRAVWFVRDGAPVEAGVLGADSVGGAIVVFDDWQPAEAVLVTLESGAVGAAPSEDELAEIPTE